MKIVLLLIFIICLICNIFLFIAKQLVNVEKFNLANIFVSYSFSIKMQELNKTKEINRRVDIIQTIHNQEIWYKNEYFFEELVKCAICEFENKNIQNGLKILQLANDMLDDWKNRYPLRLDDYLDNCSILENNVKKLKKWNNLEEVENTIKNIENKIQEFVKQADKEISGYEITQMPKEEFDKKWKKLMNYQK